jgi:hypothetical protein
MMGASDAGNMLTSVMRALGESLSDGVVTQQEFVNILNVLGVDAGNVAASLHGMLVKALENVRAAVEGNTSSVQALISQLNALNGMTAVYRIVEVRETVTQQSGGGVEVVHETGGRFFEAYQLGAWSVPRTGPALLHRGEMVLPRHVAEWFRRYGGAGGNVFNITVNINTSTADGRALAEELSRELARRMRWM